MENRTFTIIKPNAVGNQHSGEILTMIERAGFRIIGLKMLQITASDAEKFYHEHKERPFFRNLNLFMTAGPVIVAVLEKENAVVDYRKLIGPTNPDNAPEGTIRKRFAESKTRNAVHASDSNENAAWEISFFFSEREITANPYQLPVSAEEIDRD